MGLAILSLTVEERACDLAGVRLIVVFVVQYSVLSHHAIVFELEAVVLWIFLALRSDGLSPVHTWNEKLFPSSCRGGRCHGHHVSHDYA